MTHLRISPELSLDADLAGGQTFGVLAKKGAGKTYTGRVMAEEMHAAGIPFVALDPIGAWWGLRSSSSGEGAGLPVLVAGGDSPVRDLPLERSGGAVMADLVVDEALSMVLDLSALGSHAAEREFAHAFFERLYRRNRELVHVFVDEADLFAPQSPQPGDRPLLGVMENIVRRGRIKGIGITLISQRAAVLNKDVLTQVDVLALLRITGPQDRKAVLEWVKGHADAESQRDVLDSLASLQNGESWWWAPELDILTRTQVRRARTFDSSPTPRRGQRRREPKTYADVDLQAISTKIAATIERAEADDPKRLRRRIAELERDARQTAAAEPETKTEIVEVPVISDAQLDRIGSFAAQLEATSNDLASAARGLDDAVALVRQAQKTPRPAPAPQRPTRAAPSAPRPQSRREPTGDLTGPQQRVLDALAWLEAVGFPTPTKIQVGFIAGYRVGKKVGGTFGNILGELRSTGLIAYPTAGNAALTDEGRALAAPADIEQTTEGLQRAVYDRLDGPERRVLEVVVDVYPEALTKQEAGERAGYTVGAKVGGTYGNILGRLRSLGLIDYPDRGLVAAEPVVFLETAR